MSNTSIDNNSLAHTKWNCKYHIVFAPKYCICAEISFAFFAKKPLGRAGFGHAFPPVAVHNEKYGVRKTSKDAVEGRPCLFGAQPFNIRTAASTCLCSSPRPMRLLVLTR